MKSAYYITSLTPEGESRQVWKTWNWIELTCTAVLEVIGLEK
jgi:hypothetical protein